MAGDGGSVPQATYFTLWIPINIKAWAQGIDVSLRDYPIPLLHVSPHNVRDTKGKALDLGADLIIAEELGPLSSTLWVDCCVCAADRDVLGSRAFVFRVPKTVMPVKFYAKPVLKVL